ncbi:MAG TPA: hypothetical protein VIH99_13580, partial [Bdellovibrionota bacterium]
MPFGLDKLIQILHSRRPTPEEMLAKQMPGPEVDLPRTLQSVMRFAETKQIVDQILHAKRDRKIRSLAILSELPREGRTLFSATLAMSFGQLVRQKVLVVDCNTLR